MTHFWVFSFLFNYYFAMLHSMWETSSPTRDQTHIPLTMEVRSPNPGLPGKSLGGLFLDGTIHVQLNGRQHLIRPSTPGPHPRPQRLKLSSELPIDLRIPLILLTIHKALKDPL